MFNLFKKRNKKQQTIENELFGKLTFVGSTEYEPSNLFGAKHFPPSNSIVEYQNYSDTKGITQLKSTLDNNQKKYVLQ